jgi:hypothetical protein
VREQQRQASQEAQARTTPTRRFTVVTYVTAGRACGPAPPDGGGPYSNGVHDQPAPQAPAPLKVAASLTAVEALVVLGLAIAELVSTSGERLLLGLTTTVFFLLYGGLLLASAWLVTRRTSWTRGPILLAQLIQLGIAWNVRDVAAAAAVGLALVSVVVVAGMLHPATLRFLLEEDAEQTTED